MYKTLTWYVQVEKVGRDTRDLYDWKLGETVISFSSEIVNILVMAPVICYHPFLSVLKCYSFVKLKDLGECLSKYTGVTFLCCLEDVSVCDHRRVPGPGMGIVCKNKKIHGSET